MNAALRKIESRYEALNELVPLHPIRSAAGYRAAVAALNRLLDDGAADERSSLAGLVGTLGNLIAAYEALRHTMAEASGSDVLRLLMSQHGLRQADLPEIGSQGVVSEILNGRRALNARQIRALATRFKVSPAVFL